MDATPSPQLTEHPGASEPPVDLRALVNTARSLAWLSGSLLLTVLLFMGAVEIRLLNLFHAPAFLLGTAIGLVGLTILYPADRLQPRGRTYRQNVRTLLCLQVYFAPFSGWWQAIPSSLYFFINLVLFLLCLAGLLWLVGRLAGDLGQHLSDAAVISEARLCRRVSLFLVLPAIVTVGLLGIATRMGWFKPSATLAALLPETDLPAWFYTALMAGILLSLPLSWRSMQSCYRLMTRAPSHPTGPA